MWSKFCLIVRILKKKNEITINLSLFLKLYISLVEVTVFTIKSTILWVFFFYEVLTISVYCLITYLYKQIQPSPETKIKTKVNRRNKQQKTPQKTKNNPKKTKNRMHVN